MCESSAIYLGQLRALRRIIIVGRPKGVRGLVFSSHCRSVHFNPPPPVSHVFEFRIAHHVYETPPPPPPPPPPPLTPTSYPCPWPFFFFAHCGLCLVQVWCTQNHFRLSLSNINKFCPPGSMPGCWLSLASEISGYRDYSWL